MPDNCNLPPITHKLLQGKRRVNIESMLRNQKHNSTSTPLSPPHGLQRRHVNRLQGTVVADLAVHFGEA